MPTRTLEDIFSGKPYVESSIADVETLINQYSEQFNFDSEIIKSQIKQESGGKADVVSGAGAIGIMQIMPGTAKEIAEELGEEYSKEKLFDPDTNLRWGIYHMSKLRDDFGGDEAKALAAYHAGAKSVRNAEAKGKRLPDTKDPYVKITTKDYVKNIMSRIGIDIDIEEQGKSLEELFKGKSLGDIFGLPKKDPEVPSIRGKEPLEGFKIIPEPTPPSTTAVSPEFAEFEAKKPEGLAAKLPGEAMALGRGLAAEVPEVIKILPMATRVFSGASAAVQDYIETLDPEIAKEGFKEGFEGKRDIFGKSAVWWENILSKSADIIRGEAKTEGQEYQHKLAGDVITAAFITSMGANVAKIAPQMPQAIKNASKNIINKAKNSAKVLKKMKLSEQELTNVRAVHQGKIGRTVESLTQRERAFFDAAIKDGGEIQIQALKKGNLNDIVYPWEKPSWEKLKKPVIPTKPKEIPMAGMKPTPEVKPPAKVPPVKKPLVKPLEKPVVKPVSPKKPIPKEEPVTEAGFIQLPTLDYKTAKQKVPEAAKKIHEAWVSEKQVRLLESDRAVNKIQQQVKGKEQEVIPFLIEKTGIPKEFNRPDLESILKDPTKKQRLTKVAEESKKHMNEVFQYVKKHRPDMSAREIENYVTHIWDVPKNKVKEAVNWFTTYDPFLKKRFIETLSAGIKKGYKPKTTNIVEIMKIHDQHHIKTTENIRLVEALGKLQDESGIKLIQRSDKAPEGWITSDHPVLRRTLFVPGEEGKPATLLKVPVKYHPDLEPLMKSVFGKRIEATPIQIYEAFGAVLKKTQLSLSLFHHAALTETAVATIGPVKTAKIMFNAKGLYNALVKNKYDIYEKKFEVAKDGVKHGLQIGAISDVQRTLVDKLLGGLESELSRVHKVVGLPIKGVRKVNELWDKALWDYLHNNFKVYGYETLSTKLISGLKNATAKDIEIAKKEAAQMVNDTFGGQNWERMMTNPKTLQIAQWLLLSPDWTLSTVKQALAPTGIGAVSKAGVAHRRKMGAAFWARALLYFGGGLNLTNYVLTKYDDAKQRGVPFKKGKGVFMWENDPGSKTRLFVGRYPDGSKRYIRWGKQFREVPELIYDQQAMQVSPITATLRKAGSKAAPNIQLLSTIFTHHSLGGFKNRELAEASGWRWVGAAAKEIIKAPLPFAFKNTLSETKKFHLSDLAFPSSKGMTYYKAKKLFKLSVVKRNLKYIANVYKATTENDLDADEIFNDAITELKREATSEISKDVRLGKIEEPGKTLAEIKVLTNEQRRELKKKVMLENWELFLLAAEERYKAYLIEKEIMEKQLKEQK